jgi:hypothetical protein
LKKREVFAFLDKEVTQEDMPHGIDWVKTLEKRFPCNGKNPGRHRKRLERLMHQWWVDNQKKIEMLQEAGLVDDEAELPLTGGTMDDPAQRRLTEHTGRRTYVFTCAQNNTDLIPEDWWKTLLNLVDYYGAELHVSRFTYNKAAFGKKSVKPGSKKGSDERDLYYADEIEPYISDADIQITDDLVWLGSANLLPTLVNPITGWQNHTRQASCILPHTKIAMESVPTMKHDPAKFVYTTGCITQRNYIQKGAGQKADFHHVFGALLVEVDADGNWWARQLNFDKDGGLYDLNRFFTSTEVFEDVRIEAITHGDIHGYKRNHKVLDTVFGPGELLDRLMPRQQFFHDIIDFMPRNHHNRKQFAFLAEMHRRGYDKVEAEFSDIAYWLMHDAHRNWCQSHVVVSNHDQAINNWLDDRSALDDPPNVTLWFEMNLNRVRWADYHPFKALLSSRCTRAVSGDPRTKPNVILEDQSYRVKGIECGMHGHLGPNGARGNPRNLRTAGKANTGHTHSAGIEEGVYTAGVLGNLDMGYNKGLSSWSHSSILTYPNGKRAIITHRDGRWHR